MSFSSELKEELSKQISPARHCRIAEIAAILHFCNANPVMEPSRLPDCGRISHDKTIKYIKLQTENLTVATKYYILLEKTFKIRAEVSVRKNRNAVYYQVVVNDREACSYILKSIKVLDDHGGRVYEDDHISRIIVQNSCCKRAFLRGAFMAAGSVTDPYKGYHYEIVAGSKEKADIIEEILCAFNIEPKHTIRKNSVIVYVKEGSQISDLLGIMEANVSMMKLENARIFKEVRNDVNRKVNCETANIGKTTATAARQKQDIIYIRDNYGLGHLSEQLQEIARLRLENPEASLKELGEMLHPPLGKSGVNHRLRKISDMACDLRRRKEQ